MPHRMTIPAWCQEDFCGLLFGLSIFLHLSRLFRLSACFSFIPVLLLLLFIALSLLPLLACFAVLVQISLCSLFALLPVFHLRHSLLFTFPSRSPPPCLCLPVSLSKTKVGLPIYLIRVLLLQSCLNPDLNSICLPVCAATTSREQ